MKTTPEKRTTTRARYYALKAKNLCTSCMRTLDNGKAKCEPCLARKREYINNRIVNKLCVACGKPFQTDKTSCFDCLLARSHKRFAAKSKIKAELQNLYDRILRNSKHVDPEIARITSEDLWETHDNF